MITDSELGEELLKDQTEQEQQPYFIDDDVNLYRWKNSRDGFISVRISNFDAQITDDISEDDGIEVKTFYGIEGRTKGKHLPRIEVAATQFNSMNWLAKWGSQCIIEPGLSNKDYLRHAIQKRSNGIKRQTFFTHTGWRKIDNKWAYFTAGGAIGADGVSVRLPKELDFIELPHMPENEAEAIKTSFSFLGIGSQSITLPVYSYTFLAPLTTLIKPMPNFVQYLHGQTGVLKTTLARLALSHFGNAEDVALSNFEDSANAIEKRGFILKDMLHIMDDYCPSYRKVDAQQKENTVQRIIRGYSNRTGRHRLNADTSEKGAYVPRGLLLVTGEEVPMLQSTNARMSVIELSDGDIDKQKLSRLQLNAHLLPQAMSIYIRWLIENIIDIRKTFPEHFRQLRSKAYAEGLHNRLPEQSAFYQFAWNIVLSWLQDKSIITETQAQSMSQDGWNIFMELADRQSRRIEREDPVRRFREIVQTLITQGKVKLLHKELSGDIIGNEKADLLGYFDDLYMYLLPTALWNTMQRYCIAEGSHFPFSRQTFYRMLISRKLIDTDKDHSTKSEWIDGKTRKVLKIVRTLFEESDEKK